MNLTILTGSANLPLAQAVAQSLGATLGACDLQRFPDGELHVALQQSVRGEAARSDVNEKTIVVAPAASRFQSLPIHRLVVSDSLVVPSGFPIPTQIVSLSPILANAILRLHRDESLGDLVGLD